MLRLMLNQHSQLHVPNESWFLLDLIREIPLHGPLSAAQVDRALELIVEHPRWGDWQSTVDGLRNRFDGLKKPTLSQLIRATFELETGYARGWGDKTPGYIDVLAQLHELFPGAKFVHIYRDPRDVCISLMAKKWRGTEAWTIARYWRDSVEAARSQGRAMADQYLEIQYEALVTNSAAELERICKFLGVEFEQRMLAFHEDSTDQILSMRDRHHAKTKRAPNSADIERWRGELSAERIGMVEAIAGNALEAFGYQRAYVGFGRLFTFGLRTLLFVAEVTLPARQKLGIHFPNLRQRF